MSSRGFTLVEVLVALAIVATALLAGLKAVGAMAQSSAELKSRLLAHVSAQNRIAVIRASGQFLPIGDNTFPCPQGNIRFICREEITSTPNPLFRRVEVRVYAQDNEAHHLAEIIGILANEAGG